MGANELPPGQFTWPPPARQLIVFDGGAPRVSRAQRRPVEWRRASREHRATLEPVGGPGAPATRHLVISGRRHLMMARTRARKHTRAAPSLPARRPRSARQALAPPRPAPPPPPPPPPLPQPTLSRLRTRAPIACVIGRAGASDTNDRWPAPPPGVGARRLEGRHLICAHGHQIKTKRVKPGAKWADLARAPIWPARTSNQAVARRWANKLQGPGRVARPKISAWRQIGAKLLANASAKTNNNNNGARSSALIALAYSARRLPAAGCNWRPAGSKKWPDNLFFSSRSAGPRLARDRHPERLGVPPGRPTGSRPRARIAARVHSGV